MAVSASFTKSVCESRERTMNTPRTATEKTRPGLEPGYRRERYVSEQSSTTNGTTTTKMTVCRNWVTSAIKMCRYYQREKKAERVFYHQAEENLQLPGCTAAFEGHTHYFPEL